MNQIREILNKIDKTQDCIIYPPQSLPVINGDLTLPDDLLDFYCCCGGVSLFRSSVYSMEIVPPSMLVLANPKIIGIHEADLRFSNEDYSDISWSWYIIGEGENAQYITIDLCIERLGRCYDSYWDRHANPGYCPIIAKTFTELINRLLKNHGKHWYWLQPDFQSIGDAYD